MPGQLNAGKDLNMNEIIGASGTTHPINPIRKKELDDKWKAIVAKAITDEAFKKQLVADPMNAMEEQGLKVVEGLKIAVDEVTKIHKVALASGVDEEVQAEAKWWSIRLKMIKEFGVELNRQVGNVAGFEEGCAQRSII
ncbi:MAG: hypothetical protein ACI9UO_002808 [Nitrospinales bacterium]